VKRVLAIVGAIAMIVAAVLIRGVLTSDGGGGGGGSSASGGGGTHLLCATELEAVCDALAAKDHSITIQVEDAGTTAARLGDPAFDPTGHDQPFDGWLTLKPWPELVGIRLDQGDDPAVLGDESPVLATTKLAMVGPRDRITMLQTACGSAQQLGWKCLGGIAGDSWVSQGGDSSQGSVQVGHDDPTVSATGLLILDQAASDYFGKTNFASNDFDADPGFRDWLHQLENADPGLPPAVAAQPVIKQLELFPTASWDAVGTLDPQARASKARTAADLTVLYPSPMIRAEAVFAPIRGHQDVVTQHDLTSALADAGWTAGVAPHGTPASPPAGVSEALLAEWKAAT
jgi:hypothetical protein